MTAPRTAIREGSSFKCPECRAYLHIPPATPDRERLAAALDTVLFRFGYDYPPEQPVAIRDAILAALREPLP